MFDDLIPKAQSGGGLSFDDLVPAMDRAKAELAKGLNDGRNGDLATYRAASFRSNQGVQPATATDAALSGATLGFSDELGAAATAPIDMALRGEGFNEAYQHNLARDRDRLDQYRKANPKMALTAELAGGLLTPVGAGGSAIKTGAKIGALVGFGNSEGDLSQRVVDSGIGAVGGAALGTAMSGASKLFAVQAARELKPGQQVVAAANRLSETGLPVEVPKAVATDNMAIQRAASVARNVPLAGDPLVKAAERTVSQLGDKASEVAAGFGGGTVVGSGEAARDSIKGYITGKSAAESNKFYKRVDDLIDPAVTTDLRATRDAAESILARRANAAISDQSGAVKRIEEAIKKPGGLNYEGVKDLRGYVRELKDNPSLLPADISGKELNSVYDALSKDLKSAVHNAGGPEASVAFDRANRHYALLSDRREALAKIIGTSGDAPAERVFDRMVSMASSKSTADISKLAQARKAMGADDWNEFASGIIGKMGRDTANFSGPEKLQASGFSPQRFLTAYGNLSPAGKTLLFRSGGKSELANHLDDIARVSGRFKELQKFSNPSGTGQMAIGGGMGAAFMAEPLTTVTSVLGGRIVASALAKPASAASVAKLAKAQQALIINPSQSKVAAYSLAARNLINTVGAKNISPNDFLKALQAPAASRADEQQPDVPRPPGQ